MNILPYITERLIGGSAERPPSRAEVSAIADESARLVAVAKELLAIAGRRDDPNLVEDLSGPIWQILAISTALNASVIRAARPRS